MKPGVEREKARASVWDLLRNVDRNVRRVYGWQAIGVAGWLLLFAIACLRFAWSTSPTFDEPGLIHAGYANFRADATKSSTGNLIFAQNWSALPLLATQPVLPSEAELQAVEPVNREFGRLFLFHPGNDWRAILRPARVMTIVLGVALGVIVFVMSRQHFGAVAAQISLGFYCLSPVVLANSSIATTDLAAALWFTVAVNRWWVLLHRVTLVNIVVCGAATGLLFVTKFSSFALVPMILLLGAIRLFVGRPLVVSWGRSAGFEVSNRSLQVAWLVGVVVAVAVMGAATLWLCYAPQITLFADRSATTVPWDKLPQDGMIARIAVFLSRMHLLPEPYALDLWVFGSGSGVRRAFLLGEYSTAGWWYFFPVAWWFKTPLPFMIALLAAVVAIARRRSQWYALLPLVVLVGVYSGIAMMSRLNIGIRHLLPAYPALFVLAGGLVFMPWRRWAVNGLAAALLSWSALELWPVRTEFLAYFNVFAGGPREGHRVLVDSSYEWGQDLPAVEQWLAERARRPGARLPVYFSYFGNADLRRFTLDAVLLPQFFDLRPIRRYDLAAGTYLISATMLRSVYGPLFGPWRESYEAAYQMLLQQLPGMDVAATPEQMSRIALYDSLRFGRLCSYLRRRQPDARVTNGILVFELSEQELNRALREPLPESGSRYQIPGTERLPQDRVDFLK